MDWGLPGHAWELQVTGYRLDDSNVIGKGIIRIVIHLANMINYMAAGYETRFGMNDSIGGKTRSWSCADQPRRESIVGLEGFV